MEQHDDGKWAKLAKVLRWALGVSPAGVRSRVEELRSQHPRLSSGELAKKLYTRAAWKASVAGAGTGLPSNVFVSIPAALADVAAVLRIEVATAACVAELYEPGYLNDGETPWELLVPILNLNGASQAAREFAILAGQQATNKAIRAMLQKNGLKTFQTIVLKVAGKRVTRKAVLTKSLPLVGALVGAAWNYGELKVQGTRIVRYFETRPTH